MASELLIAERAYSWGHQPQAWYNSDSNTTLFSLIATNGVNHCLHYDHATRRLWSVVGRASFGDSDLHNHGTVISLASSGSRPNAAFFAWSGHNNQLSTKTGHISGRVGSLGAAVLPGSNTATYPIPLQAADTAKTLYLFHRQLTSGTPNLWDRRFRKSTDGGVTWGSSVIWLVDNGGSQEDRPYPLMAHIPGTSRFDFVIMSGHPDEVTDNHLTAGYLEVDTDGSHEWFKSDGTSLGDDTALPFEPDDFTTVVAADSSFNYFWQDLGWVDGVLTLIYTRMTPYDNSTDHEYYRTQLVSGSWTTPEKIADAGETGTSPHWYHSAQWHGPGGACLDPYDSDSVYLSRKYGSGDFRVEKWTKSGTWAKSEDVSGNTGSLNITPAWVRNSPSTRIVYLRGTVTNDTSWDLDVYTYPGLAVVAAPLSVKTKPTVGAWNTAFAPAGAKSYIPLLEGTGTTVRDYVTGNVHAGTFVGSPTWGSGTYGPQISGWSTSNYITCLLPVQTIASGVYPFWVAAMFFTSSTTAGELLTFGSSSSDTPWIRVNTNDGGTSGRTSYLGRGSVGTGFNIHGTSPVGNDGNPHICQMVSWSATDHGVYLDGALIASATSNLSPLPVMNQMTIGILRRIGVVNPFTGTIIAVAHGEGGAPDPVELAEDWLMGTFAAIRPRQPRGAARTGNNMNQHGIKSGGIL